MKYGKGMGMRMREYRLYDLAAVIRSKNSGPFQITLDVLFDRAGVYYEIKKSGAICKERIASIYRMDVSRIQEPVFFDTALGFKVTFDRSISSGTAGDRDVYGAQQHAPLSELKIALSEDTEDGRGGLCNA